MENKINIGDFDTLITIKECTITTGSQGQKTKTYREHSRVWAKITSVIDESVAEGNLEADASLQLALYKIPDLTTRWRVAVNGKDYEIRTIDTISRASRLFILTVHSIDG